MEGRRVPNVVFKTRVRDGSVEGPNPYRWEDLPSADIFSGRRVIVFALPGAFTPTCSNQQCPAFELQYDDLRKAGIDEVYCLSVNDAFVMHQWARHLNLSKVKLIPDGSGNFTRRMGMLVNKEHLGFGYRSWRYVMIVNDGVVEKWFEEPGINDEGADDDPYSVTDPAVALSYLRRAPTAEGQVAVSPNEGRLGPAGEPAEGKRYPEGAADQPRVSGVKSSTSVR